MDASKYLREFELGERFTTVSHTVTESAVITYAGITGDFHPLHTDAEYARQTIYGERIAHGLLIAGIGLALWTRVGILENSAIGQLNCQWSFPSAVRFGDTIHCEIEVEGIKRSKSKPDRGVLSVRMDVLNQRGECVAVNHTDSMVLWERPEQS